MAGFGVADRRVEVIPSERAGVNAAARRWRLIFLILTFFPEGMDK